MNILGILDELEAYYQHTRQVGHTTAMIEGAKNTEGVIILAHDMKYAKKLARQCSKGATPVSLGSLEHRLRDHCRPLLIDNSAMWWLLQDAIKEIKELRFKVAKQEGG